MNNIFEWKKIDFNSSFNDKFCNSFRTKLENKDVFEDYEVNALELECKNQLIKSLLLDEIFVIIEVNKSMPWDNLSSEIYILISYSCEDERSNFRIIKDKIENIKLICENAYLSECLSEFNTRRSWGAFSDKSGNVLDKFKNDYEEMTDLMRERNILPGENNAT